VGVEPCQDKSICDQVTLALALRYSQAEALAAAIREEEDKRSVDRNDRLCLQWMHSSWKPRHCVDNAAINNPSTAQDGAGAKRETSRLKAGDSSEEKDGVPDKARKCLC
jgi:hypothetical protein